MDDVELDLLTDTLRKATASVSGPELHRVLVDLGWREMLAEMPDTAIPLVFRMLGEHGTHAPLINDVVRHVADEPLDDPAALPYAGGGWVVWAATGDPGDGLDTELPLHRVGAGRPFPLAVPRQAIGWWLTGSARAMLGLARAHALDRVQFGRPVAGFQAVRHRLAETLVAIEGAESALALASDDLSALLAKAAAGQAALTAGRHCQQVLGGIGFTAEHGLHRHIRRTLVLDGLLGSSRELTAEAGRRARARGSAPRLVHL